MIAPFRILSPVILCIVAQTGTNDSLNVPEGPRLHVESSRIDLGKSIYPEEVAHTFQFENVGSQDLVILDIEAPCGCLYELPEQWSFPPLSQGWIKIKYDLSDKDYGRYQESVTLHTNDPAQEATTFTIEIEYVPPVAITPKTIEFELDGDHTQGLMVTTHHGTERIELIDAIVGTPEHLSLKLVSEEDIDNRTEYRYELDLVQYPSAPLLSSVLFHTNSPVLPFAELPVTVNGEQRVEYLPLDEQQERQRDDRTAAYARRGLVALGLAIGVAAAAVLIKATRNNLRLGRNSP